MNKAFGSGGGGVGVSVGRGGPFVAYTGHERDTPLRSYIEQGAHTHITLYFNTEDRLLTSLYIFISRINPHTHHSISTPSAEYLHHFTFPYRE